MKLTRGNKYYVKVRLLIEFSVLVELMKANTNHVLDNQIALQKEQVKKLLETFAMWKLRPKDLKIVKMIGDAISTNDYSQITEEKLEEFDKFIQKYRPKWKRYANRTNVIS